MLEAHSEEIEVLRSIYPDEFESLAAEPSPIFKIHLKPSSEEVFIAIALVCELPRTYPEETAPFLSIEIEKGLSSIHADELAILADTTATENIGMPCVFTVAEILKEWLIDNNVAGQDGSMYSGRGSSTASFAPIFPFFLFSITHFVIDTAFSSRIHHR